MHKKINFILMVCIGIAIVGIGGGAIVWKMKKGGVVSQKSAKPAPTQQIIPQEEPLAPLTLTYENREHGFRVLLPESWKGYAIVSDTWEGSVAGPKGDKAIEHGPIVVIRNPQWTQEVPWQDIPVMVFTLAQWDALSRDAFHIGAAPIGPSELGRNAIYVFALPARYNYAFPVGYQEVEKIIAAKAFSIPSAEPSNGVPSEATAPNAVSTMHAVTVHNFSFDPAELRIKKGDTITWTNNDPATHTVTADQGAGPASGLLDQGGAYSYTFNASGTFDYHCNIHRSMAGKIIVQ